MIIKGSSTSFVTTDIWPNPILMSTRWNVNCGTLMSLGNHGRNVGIQLNSESAFNTWLALL